MRTCQLRVLKAAALGAAISLGTIGAASASPMTFSWNPSATGDTTAGTFSADNFGINDYAGIAVPTDPSTPGSVTESGFLEISGFTLNNTPTSTVHTTGAGGYGIYTSFSATSHLAKGTTPTGSGLFGTFDSITASTYLYSTANGLASYSFSGGAPSISLPTGANQMLLATQSGPTSASPNQTSIMNGVPAASVDTLWTASNSDGFFVAPPASMVLDLDHAFTNTASVITIFGTCSSTGTGCTYEINGGGGNANFLSTPVPEPGSLALLGTGLVAFGMIGFALKRRQA